MRAILDAIDLLRPLGKTHFYEVGHVTYAAKVMHLAVGQTLIQVSRSPDDVILYHTWIPRLVDLDRGIEVAKAAVCKAVVNSDPVYSDEERTEIGRLLKEREKDIL